MHVTFLTVAAAIAVAGVITAQVRSIRTDWPGSTASTTRLPPVAPRALLAPGAHQPATGRRHPYRRRASLPARQVTVHQLAAQR